MKIGKEKNEARCERAIHKRKEKRNRNAARDGRQNILRNKDGMP